MIISDLQGDHGSEEAETNVFIKMDLYDRFKYMKSWPFSVSLYTYIDVQGLKTFLKKEKSYDKMQTKT